MPLSKPSREALALLWAWLSKLEAELNAQPEGELSGESSPDEEDRYITTRVEAQLARYRSKPTHARSSAGGAVRRRITP